jgi:hypothetical protein
MREHVRRVTLSGPGGARVPLVRAEWTIFESSAPAPPDRPPFWLPWYLLLGAAIGVGALLLARPAQRHPAARFGFLTLAGGWAAVAGLAGLVLAGLWGLTDHVAASHNENLLQVSPLALLLLPSLRPALRGKDAARLGYRVALVLAGLSVAGLGLKLVPGFGQVNGPVIALALPAQLGIAAALRRLRGVVAPAARSTLRAPAAARPAPPGTPGRR